MRERQCSAKALLHPEAGGDDEVREGGDAALKRRSTQSRGDGLPVHQRLFTGEPARKA
jgi:hypothetical protein